MLVYIKNGQEFMSFFIYFEMKALGKEPLHPSGEQPIVSRTFRKRFPHVHCPTDLSENPVNWWLAFSDRLPCWLGNCGRPDTALILARGNALFSNRFGNEDNVLQHWFFAAPRVTLPAFRAISYEHGTMTCPLHSQLISYDLINHP